MKKIVSVLILSISALGMSGCTYNQVGCSTCGYTPTTTYVPSASYVTTTRYVPVVTSNYVAPTYTSGCCSVNCCPNCNRCGAGYYGYGAGYGYNDYDNSTWY